jgi:hypothetical protein
LTSTNNGGFAVHKKVTCFASQTVMLVHAEVQELFAQSYAQLNCLAAGLSILCKKRMRSLTVWLPGSGFFEKRDKLVEGLNLPLQKKALPHSQTVKLRIRFLHKTDKPAAKQLSCA